MGALGSIGTLRPPGVWYIACHQATKECGPSSGARRPVWTAAAADGAMAGLRTATSPAGNGAIILEAVQIQ